MKKIILLLLVCVIALSSYAQKQTINNGDSGSSVRTKLNSNFTELYNGKINNGDSYVNVKNFGAVGDGIADDRTAILNAIASLDTLGGTIFLPVGKYKVSTTIKVYKSVHFQGVPVLGYITSAGTFEYKAGSQIVSGGSGIAVLELRAKDKTNVELSNSSVSDIGFIDLAGRNDTLLVVRNKCRVKVYDCSFYGGAVGLKIDSAADDASWCNINNNHFWMNKIGIYLSEGTTNIGVPATIISGGDFTVGADCKGIYATRASQSSISNFKMDVFGDRSIGIDWIGANSSISGVKIELTGTGNSTIGIISRGNQLTMSDIAIQGNNSTGIGIKIAKGASRANPNTHNSISNITVTNCNYGVFVADTVTGAKITNASFLGSIGTANIYLTAGSAYHQISNITSNKFVNVTGGLFDYSTNSTIKDYTFIDGGDILQYAGTRVFINAKTDNYTLALDDIGKLVSMNASTAKTITIPLNSVVAYPIGTVIYLTSIGSGDTSIAITSGGTLNSEASYKKIGVQNGSAYIIKTGTDTWMLCGRLKA